jgi:FkbM family methyltransferase
MISKILKSLLLNLHIQHENAYSYYKVMESGLSTEYPLDAKERNFYLAMRSALVGNNLVVYDIGAANGTTAKCFAKLKQISSIHAFEPIPASYQELAAVSRQFVKIECYQVAMGNITGEKTLYLNNFVNASSLLSPSNLLQKEVIGVNITDKIQIQVVRLDEYVREKSLPIPHLIKIDVQGYEKEVIAGGIDTISKAKYCFMEMSFQSLYDGSPLFGDVYPIMVDLGFRLVGVSSPMIGKSGTPLQIDGLFVNQQNIDYNHDN